MRQKTATRDLATLAAEQHGVVSLGQLETIGYSSRRILREVAVGRLHRFHRGVYAVGHPALNPHGQCLAAVLACGRKAVLSHESAAWVWGISTRWPPIPHVTTTATVRHTKSDIRVHSARTLRRADVTLHEDITLTAVPRTLLDLAGVDPRSLRWALPRAKRLGLLDLLAIDSLLRRSRGRRGVRALRAELSRFRSPAFTRSDVETRFLELVVGAGLPQPSMNSFVSAFELDAYWPDLRFAVELDTYEHHGDEVSFETDRLRQEDLKLAGIEMIRVTGRRLDEAPEAVVARLRRLLARRHQEISIGA